MYGYYYLVIGGYHNHGMLAVPEDSFLKVSNYIQREVVASGPLTCYDYYLVIGGYHIHGMLAVLPEDSFLKVSNYIQRAFLTLRVLVSPVK